MQANIINLAVAAFVLSLGAWLGARASRAVARRLPATGDVHARIAKLRAGSSWPGLRRGARAFAVLTTIALMGGASLAAVPVVVGAIVSAALNPHQSPVILVLTPVVVALATAIAWAIEHALHVTLDLLDVVVQRALPQGDAAAEVSETRRVE